MFGWFKKKKEEKMIFGGVPAVREIKIGDVYSGKEESYIFSTAIVLSVVGSIVVYAQINGDMSSWGLHQCSVRDFHDKYHTECTPGLMDDIWPMVQAHSISVSTQKAVDLARKRIEDADIEKRKIDEWEKNIWNKSMIGLEKMARENEEKK